MDTLLSLFSTEAVMGLALGLLGLAAAAALRSAFVGKYRLERAVQCLEAGVRKTYEEYVRARKRAAADGKLDDEQRREANRRAREAALAFARAEGLDLAKYYAAEYLPVLIDRLAQKSKNENGAATNGALAVAAKVAAAALPMILKRLNDADEAVVATPAVRPDAAAAAVAGVLPDGADLDPLEALLKGAGDATRDPFSAVSSPAWPAT